MQVHDLDAVALLIVGGRNEKGQIQADKQQQAGGPAKPGNKPAGELQEQGRIGVFEHGVERRSLCRHLIRLTGRHLQLSHGKSAARGRRHDDFL